MSENPHLLDLINQLWQELRRMPTRLIGVFAPVGHGTDHGSGGSDPIDVSTLAGIVTTVGDPGSDSNVPTEQAVREAIGGELGSVPSQTVIGRNSAGTGDFEYVTASELLDWLP